MWVRLAACLVWALLSLSAVYWSFKLFVRPGPVPSHALPVAVDQAARGDPLRLFASPAPQVAAPVAPQAASRFKLVGVMAPRTPDPAAPSGLALIAVDGKPARAYQVGARVDGEWVLQSVSPRSASLGPQGGAVVAQLEVPALPGPATGTLPSAAQDLGGSPPPPAVLSPDAGGPPPGMAPPPGGARPPLPGASLSPSGVPPRTPGQGPRARGIPNQQSQGSKAANTAAAR
jgi:general secretion pathway protein C